jgi:uncharacterized protein (UPF0548 family)
MISLSRPTPAAIDAELRRAAGRPFSYPDIGATRGAPPAGYVVDHNRVQVGRGEAAFRAARECLLRWDMFRLGWVELCPSGKEVREGAVVGALARVWGAWWLNPCRVVYLEDGPRRVRFAYGTLAGHAESGEERFTAEWLDDDTVWYDLYAFSRAGTWLTRLGYPLARRLQRKFARDSKAAFAAACGTAASASYAGDGASPFASRNPAAQR